MLTITLVLVLAALVCTLAHAIGWKMPLWLPVLLLCLVHLLVVLPR